MKTLLVRFGRISAVFVAALAACGAPNSNRPQVVAPGTALQDPMATIARFEDARSDGDGLLETLAGRGDERTRERAVMALGRLDRDEHGLAVTEALVGALGSDSARVRAAAAFALGQRADPRATKDLLARWNDEDPLVRARIVEAASRIDDPALRQEIPFALNDADAMVRREALLGSARMPADAPDAAVVDSAIVEFLGRVTKPGDARPAPDADARASGLFALARRKAERGRVLFSLQASAVDVRARIYAMQGLGAIALDAAGRKALNAGLADRDWRVAAEAAIALGKQIDPESAPALVNATTNASPHVRRVAFESLGRYATVRNSLRAAMDRAVSSDTSANVRAASIEALARLFPENAAAALETFLEAEDPLVRAGATLGAAHLPAKTAVPLLVKASSDANLRVAGLALSGLGKHDTPEAHDRLTLMLRNADNGLRLAAIEALRDHPRESDLPLLVECLATSEGDIAAEVAQGCIESASKSKADAAREIVARGLSHRDAFVRRKARAVRKLNWPEVPLPRLEHDEGHLGGSAAPTAWERNPRVVIETNRGALTFELLPDEAPRHVRNFLELVRAGHYDLLEFHRVVPDFVIQGGDYRGDGNGGRTWNGSPLRSEFTPRKFVRGSLGMPRNEDPDSGGSQFFVTHRDTPHLDGRYTIFGELREGFDVLDAIEVGDTIRSMKLLNADAQR